MTEWGEFQEDLATNKTLSLEETRNRYKLVASEPTEAVTLKHTLGPWHVESKAFPFVLDQHSLVVVELPRTALGRRQAQLIAAAPELLEELEMALLGLAVIGTPWAVERAGFIQALIAKVKGP